MKRIVFSGLIIALALVLVSAALFSLRVKNLARNKAMIIKKENNGQELTLHTGDVLQIELDAAGGTGYSWYLDNLDEEHLKLISEETKNASPDKVGAPITKVWQFKVLEKGTSGISLDYYRIWEGKEKAIDHFSIRIIIE